MNFIVQTETLTYTKLRNSNLQFVFTCEKSKGLDEFSTPVLVSGQQLSSLTVGFSETRAVGRSENPGGSNIKVVGPPA